MSDAFYVPFFINNELKISKLLRAIFWQMAGVTYGDSCYFSDNLKIIAPGKIRMGKNSKILNKVILDGRGGIEIGSNTQIGFESIILTGSHNYDNISRPISKQGMNYKPISIGDNVWVGARVMILQGVTVGSNSIVGAMSLVIKDVEANSINGGIPCKFIKKYGDKT